MKIKEMFNKYKQIGCRTFATLTVLRIASDIQK